MYQTLNELQELGIPQYLSELPMTAKHLYQCYSLASISLLHYDVFVIGLIGTGIHGYIIGLVVPGVPG
jgi:hypothetical protein